MSLHSSVYPLKRALGLVYDTEVLYFGKLLVSYGTGTGDRSTLKRSLGATTSPVLEWYIERIEVE